MLLTFLVRFARRQLLMKEAAAAGGKPEVLEEAAVLPEITPRDVHNDLLVANVRPPDWVNPTPAPRYNLVVIGGGTAGLVTRPGPQAWRQSGPGGTPSPGRRLPQLRLRALQGHHPLFPAYADLRDAGRFGLKVPAGVEVDFAAVMERLRRLRAGISSHDAAARLRDLGVDVFLVRPGSTAPILWPWTGKPCASPGSHRHGRPTGAPGGAGPGGGRLSHQRDGFFPDRAAPAPPGAGRRPHRLRTGPGPPSPGLPVTLLHKYDRLMNREDSDAAALVQKVFAREGINLILEAKPTQVAKTGRKGGLF